jgi:predicted transcriptional regulator
MNIETIGRWSDYEPDDKDNSIMAVIAANKDGLMAKDVAALTGLKEVTARYHLTALELTGQLRAVRKGRKNVYYFSAEQERSEESR